MGKVISITTREVFSEERLEKLAIADENGEEIKELYALDLLNTLLEGIDDIEDLIVIKRSKDGEVTATWTDLELERLAHMKCVFDFLAQHEFKECEEEEA